jgi:hypothetical protein
VLIDFVSAFTSTAIAFYHLHDGRDVVTIWELLHYILHLTLLYSFAQGQGSNEKIFHGFFKNSQPNRSPTGVVK